jgi:hypothetical protein
MSAGATLQSVSASPLPGTVEVVTPSVTTSNSSLGLSLAIQLSSAGPSNGNASFTVSLMNLNSAPLPAADDWAYSPQSLSENDGCAFNGTLAFGIFLGDLNYTEYPHQDPLALYNTSVQLTCTATMSSAPLAAHANDSLAFSTSGIWTGGANTLSPATFTAFLPGQYTVVGVDEWGQVLLSHFDVIGAIATTSSFTPPTTSTKASSLSSLPTGYVLLVLAEIGIVIFVAAVIRPRAKRT